MRKILSLVTLALLAACASQSHSASTAAQSAFLKTGGAAPQFATTTLDGKEVSLSAYHGKTLLLLFSTTWCGPCRVETADVIRMYRKLHSPSVDFLRIDPQESASTVRAFVDEYGEPYTIALDPSGSIIQSGYDTLPAFPTSYVIDPNGIVRGVDLRPYQYAAYIRAAAHGKTYVAPLSPAARAILNQVDPRRFTFKGNEAAVVAQVKAAQAAIDAAEQRAPDNTDFHPIFQREHAINDKMIAALRPVAHSAAARKLLLTLELNREEDTPMAAGPATQQKAELAEVQYAKALLAMNPSDVNVEFQLVSALALLKHSAASLQLAKTYAKKYPGISTYQTMSWYYEFTKNPSQQAIWEGKLLQLQEQLAKASPTDDNLTTVDEEARYLASLEAQLGHVQRAMQLYQFTLATIAKMKHPSRFTQLDIQDVETGELALRLEGKTKGTAIFIEPWSGAPLPGSTANTIKYRLVVVGTPNTDVQLTAMHYASGWLPSFCSNNLCSPIRRLVSVPDSGALMLEFQMIPNDPAAPRVSPVTVVASGSGSTTSTSLTTHYRSSVGS